MCQYFAIEFPRPTNTILGRLGRGKGGGGRQASSNQYHMGRPGKTRPLCAAELPVGPPLCLWWWLFQANNYSGMELTLLDPTCKAKMNGTHFILESPLSGCGTWHRRSAPDGVIYYNSVSVPQNKAWPFARSFLGVSLKLALKFL